MRKKAILKVTFFFLPLVFVAIFTGTACGSDIQRANQAEPTVITTLKNPEQDLGATKTVSHALGQVEIPLHPQRIVVLDANGAFYIDALSSLGITPVGVTRCSDCISLESFRDFLDGVPNVGNHQQPSLEKILSLKPDLILGYEWQKSFYPRLSEIAPTVMMDLYSGGNDFKRNFKYLAEIFDKSSQAEGILEKYDVKVKEFQQQIGDKLQDKTASLLSFFDATVHVYGLEILAYVQILRDVGVQFIDAYEELENDYLRLSLETLPDWDADFLFLELYYREEFEDAESLSLFTEPIWSSLNAVQKDQVYIVGWYGGGPTMANRVIDDLYEYFTEVL